MLIVAAVGVDVSTHPTDPAEAAHDPKQEASLPSTTIVAIFVDPAIVPPDPGITRHLDLRFSVVRDNFELLTPYLLGHVILLDFMDYTDKHCPNFSFAPLTA